MAAATNNYDFGSTYYDDSGLRASRTRDDGSTVFFIYDESGLSGNVPLAEYTYTNGSLALNATNFAAGPDGLRERSYYFSMDKADEALPSDLTNDYFTYDPLGNPIERLRWDPAFQSASDVIGGVAGGGNFAPWLLDQFAFDAWGDMLKDFEPA